MTKIYTYYAPVPELHPFDEVKLTILWRERWAKAGFDPIVLNTWHAQSHPFYLEMSKGVSALPTRNPKKYEQACYMRWLALAEVGGGIMADYDVLPTNDFNSFDGLWVEGCCTVLQSPCCPSVVVCPREIATELCHQFASGRIGNRPQGDTPHYSDQYALDDLVMCEDKRIVVKDIVKIWSDFGWEQAPMVHFCNAVMQPKKLMPRWRHIPDLLKEPKV